MKNLLVMTEASKEEALPEIYCDMDMVLVNFMKGADAVVGGNGFVGIGVEADDVAPSPTTVTALTL